MGCFILVVMTEGIGEDPIHISKGATGPSANLERVSHLSDSLRAHIESLADLLKSPDEEVRGMAALALEHAGLAIQDAHEAHDFRAGNLPTEFHQKIDIEDARVKGGWIISTVLKYKSGLSHRSEDVRQEIKNNLSLVAKHASSLPEVEGPKA